MEVQIKITESKAALKQHWDDAYANEHAGKVYTADIGLDGWATIDGAKFHQCCYMRVVFKSELTTIRMVAGNERKYSKVIFDCVVKEWVGIGWIDTGDIPDGTKYPKAID